MVVVISEWGLGSVSACTHTLASGEQKAPKWSEGGCSVAACPGVGRARRRLPTTPSMSMR